MLSSNASSSEQCTSSQNYNTDNVLDVRTRSPEEMTGSQLCSFPTVESPNTDHGQPELGICTNWPQMGTKKQVSSSSPSTHRSVASSMVTGMQGARRFAKNLLLGEGYIFSEFY